MFLDEVTHFIDCVAGRSTPLIPLTEAKAVLEVLTYVHVMSRGFVEAARRGPGGAGTQGPLSLQGVMI